MFSHSYAKVTAKVSELWGVNTQAGAARGNGFIISVSYNYLLLWDKLPSKLSQLI